MDNNFFSYTVENKPFQAEEIYRAIEDELDYSQEDYKEWVMSWEGGGRRAGSKTVC